MAGEERHTGLVHKPDDFVGGLDGMPGRLLHARRPPRRERGVSGLQVEVLGSANNHRIDAWRRGGFSSPLDKPRSNLVRQGPAPLRVYVTDHRNTRARVRSEAQDKRVLNLFAYTGSFTCYALGGGARATTTVDLSQTYCDWTRRNFAHNGFAEGAAHRVVQADCLAFLQEEHQRRARYDLIVCDPPTFSNSKRMAQSSFDVVRDHPALKLSATKEMMV